MMSLSVVFWVLALPLVLGSYWFVFTPLSLPLIIIGAAIVAPAMTTLFAMADPRRIVNRPDTREIVAFFRDAVRRSWPIAAVTFIPLAVLAWNIAYFSNVEAWIGVFIPLWSIIFIFVFILTQFMFSLSGTMESRLRNAFRGAMFVLVTRPFRSLFLSLLILALTPLFALTVLPIVLFGPALVAAVVNRFVFDPLQVEVIDPNKPTSERDYERSQGLNPEPTVWERIRRGGRS